MFGKLASVTGAKPSASSKPAPITASAASSREESTITRTLQLDVIEARGLLACQKNGTSDPYVIAVLTDLGGRELKAETFNTKQKNGTLSPNWNESFVFGKYPDHSLQFQRTLL